MHSYALMQFMSILSHIFLQSMEGLALCPRIREDPGHLKADLHRCTRLLALTTVMSGAFWGLTLGMQIDA